MRSLHGITYSRWVEGVLGVLLPATMCSFMAYGNPHSNIHAQLADLGHTISTSKGEYSLGSQPVANTSFVRRCDVQAPSAASCWKDSMTSSNPFGVIVVSKAYQSWLSISHAGL